QFADTAEVVGSALRINGLCVAALIPNLRGAENAIRAGAHKLSLPFSVSATHLQRNLNRTHVELLAEVRKIVALVKSIPAATRPHFEVGLSTAFGCSIEGQVEQRCVIDFAEKLM